MRCKCCDAVLQEHEVIWNDARQAFEELCLACRGRVAEFLRAEFDSFAEAIPDSSSGWFSLGDGCWWVRGLDNEH